MHKGTAQFNMPRSKRLMTVAVLLIVLAALGFWIYNSQHTAAPAAAGWYDEDWLYRMKFTVAETNIDADLTDFPVAVQFKTSATNPYSYTNSNGSDVRFTDNDGNLLKYEIESWNESGTSTVWVNLPAIDSSADTNFYLYYGNTSAQDAQTPTQVWDTDFRLVQHFEETASSTKSILDSTSNSHDGTPLSPTLGALGQLNGAADFDGSDDRIEFSSLASQNYDNFTLEAWIKTDVSSLSDDMYIYVHHEDATNRIMFALSDDAGGTDRVRLWREEGGTSSASFSTADVVDQQWHHVAATRTSGGVVAIYVDGQDNTGTNPTDALSTISLDASSGPFSGDLPGDTEQFNGIIDELRYSTVVRSAAWIKATYHAGKGDLYAQGTQEQGPGPVGYWSFDEGYGSTANDQTVNNNDGTISGATWKSEDQCRKGKCLLFDGVDDRVSVVNNNIINITADQLSISAWVYATGSPTDFAGILSKDAAQTAGYRLLIDDGNTNKVYFQLYNGGIRSLISTNPIAIGQWNNITAVYDGSQMKIYINGQLDPTILQTSGNLTGSADELWIGHGDQVAGQSYSYPFGGLIDEVKIYNYARTAAQVKQDYNQGGSVFFGGNADNSSLVDGLVGWWKLDENAANGCSGGVNDSCDSSGSGNNGAWNGNTAATSTAKFGRAAVFDGTSDYIDVGNVNAGDYWTVSAWFNVDDLDNDHSIVSQWEGSVEGFEIDVDNVNDDIAVAIYDGTSYEVGPNTLYTGYTVTPQQWTHVAVTYDHSTYELRVYANGALIGNKTMAPFDRSEGAMRIGANNNETYQMDGLIDEVRVYNRILSPDEVRHLYGWAPGPVHYWPFEEKSGTTISNRSGVYSDTGTWSGAGSHWGTGKYGTAGVYNGSDDSASVSDSTNFDNLYTGSLTQWFRMEALVAGGGITQSLVGKNAGGSNNGDVLGGLIQTGAVRYVFDDAVTQPNFVSTTVFSAGSWNYLAITWNATSTGVLFEMYMNGVKEAEQYRAPGIQPFSSSVVMGLSSTNFTGQLDEVKIYNYALNSRQILEDMHAGQKNNPIGYWSFDEGQGTTAYDSGLLAAPDLGSSGNDGTLTNMTTSGTSTAWMVNGMTGGALQFDGTDDVVTVTNATAIDLNTGLLNSLSVSAWIRADSDGEGNFGQILWKGADTYLRVANESGDNLDIAASVDLATTDAKATTTAAITKNTWHHVVVTWENDNDDELSIYVDGELKTTSTNGAGNPATESNNLLIGGTTTTNFDGMIDEFKLYNYPLTFDEIRENYNVGSQASLSKSAENVQQTAEGLVGWWKMDETSWNGAADQVIDYSGAGNHGVSGGSANATSTAQYGRAGDFNGTTDYVDIGSIGQNAETITLWFRPNAIVTRESSAAGLMSIASSAGYDEIYLGASTVNLSNEVITVMSYDDSGAVNGRDGWCGSDAISVNWHHLAVRWNGRRNEIYLDGKLLNNCESGAASALNATDVDIGRDGATYYSGQVDDVKIYNYARSEDHIRRDYADGPGPVAWWKMDEKSGASAADSSGAGSAGTLNNGPTWGTGADCKLGSCLKFDASDDYVSAGSADIIDNIFSGGGSVSYWIKPVGWGESNFGRVVDKSADVDATSGWSSYLTSFNRTVRLERGFSTAEGAWAAPDDALTLDQWNHVVITYDDKRDSDNPLIYVNGVSKTVSEVETPSGAPQDDEAQTIYIGNRSGGTDRTFDGYIDEVKLFKYTLTPRQIAQEYNSGRPVGYWKLDEGQGETAYDNSGNGNDGTVFASVSGSNTATTSMWTNGAIGKINGSLDFDGTDDRVVIADNNMLDHGSASFTVSAWVKHNVTGVTDVYLAKTNGNLYTSGSGYEIFFRTDNAIEAAIGGGSTNYIRLIGRTSLADTSSWVHIVAVFDRSDPALSDIYINGKPEAATQTITIGDTDSVSNSVNLVLGNESDGGFAFDGQIDEAKVWNYALTPEEVRQEYNGGFTTYFK